MKNVLTYIIGYTVILPIVAVIVIAAGALTAGAMITVRDALNNNSAKSVVANTCVWLLK
jgi:hypothetical protein